MEWVGYILWKNTNGEPRMVMLLSLRNISPSLCKRVAQVSLVAFLTSLLQRPITPCLIINYLKTLASNDYSLFIPVFIFFFYVPSFYFCKYTYRYFKYKKQLEVTEC